MSKRIEWLDFCKAVGIILVVLGHVMLGSTISKVYIYGFHMPLFFFLSGIVFDRRKYDFRAFIRRRFDTIIVPYVFFYLITWLYWGLIERHFRPLEMEWWKPLLGLFYGAQWNGFMDHNGILWFLPCLFMVEMLAYNVLGRTDKWWKAVIIVGAFFLVGLLVRNQLPWCLNQAMVCLPFFCAGYAMKRTLLNDELRKYQLIIALVLGVLYLLIQNTTRNEVNIATGVYGNPIIFLTSAFLGTIMLIATCKTLNINQLYEVIGGGCRAEYTGHFRAASARIKDCKISFFKIRTEHSISNGTLGGIVCDSYSDFALDSYCSCLQ